MDTVMNSLSGPYIQTFIFPNTSFMIGFLHNEKTSASMAKVLDNLQELLGYENYNKLFSLILTDRGSEFEKRECYAGKTPYEMFEFFYDKDNEISNLFNIQKIESDKVILKPYLLKTVK